ncbi:MAG: DnaJ domain-containing protein [Azospirillum sp.]|nr:DnaJ domain-containing protein [Azospirillum sp.]
MIYRFLLGIALLLGIYLLTRKIRNSEPFALARVMLYIFGTLLLGIFAFLLVERLIGPAIVMGLSIVPVFAAWYAIRLYLRARQSEARRWDAPIEPAKPPPVEPEAAAEEDQGESISRIETRFLRMTLDHRTGAVESEIMRGRLRGRSLDKLVLTELLGLLAECRSGDPQSTSVLETYLDRVHEGEWRVLDAAAAAKAGANSESEARAGNGLMNAEEAYGILGLQPGASAEAIKEAHRRLMVAVHPDRGGSTYLAAKINQARDALLHAS